MWYYPIYMSGHRELFQDVDVAGPEMLGFTAGYIAAVVLEVGPEGNFIFHKPAADRALDQIDNLNHQINAYIVAKNAYADAPNLLRNEATSYLDQKISNSKATIAEIKEQAPTYGALQKAESIGIFLSEGMALGILVGAGIHKARKALAIRRQNKAQTLNSQPA